MFIVKNTSRQEGSVKLKGQWVTLASGESLEVDENPKEYSVGVIAVPKRELKPLKDTKKETAPAHPGAVGTTTSGHPGATQTTPAASPTPASGGSDNKGGK